MTSKAKQESNKFPGSWIKRGQLYVHPHDDMTRFPSIIFRENPKTFVPTKNYDGEGNYRVFQWGLYDDPPAENADDEDGMTGMMAMMKRMMGGNNNYLYYPDPQHPNPMTQFISVLMKRKELNIDSNVLIQEAIANRSLVIRVSLSQCENDVWRRIRVPASTSLAVLHDQILGPVMGFCRGYHGYVFEDPRDGTVYGPKDYSGYIDMMHVAGHYHEIMDDRTIPLAALLCNVGDVASYTYDLGDSWKHKLIVESVSELDTDNLIEILDGSGACPPEDSNGLKGMGPVNYKKLLDKCRSNPNSVSVRKAIQEIESSASNYTTQWLTNSPVKFRPFDYDLTLHRCTLEVMVAGPRIQKPKDMMMNTFKENLHKCAACGDRLKPLLTCSVCLKERYCSKECQKEHWKVHKSLCKVIAKKN